MIKRKLFMLNEVEKFLAFYSLAEKYRMISIPIIFDKGLSFFVKENVMFDYPVDLNDCELINKIEKNIWSVK